MQWQSRVLFGRTGRAVKQLLGHHRIRGLQSSTKSLSDIGRLPSVSDGASPSSQLAADAVTPRLHTVLRVKQGFNTFAVATVTFCAPLPEPGETAAATLGSAAQHAAQVVLLALRGALGSPNPPSALFVLPSLELPKQAVAALTGTLAEGLVEGPLPSLRQGGPQERAEVAAAAAAAAPIVGCSSRLRLPDERRAVAESIAVAAAGSPAPNQHHDHLHRFHVTLAAAYLPDHEVVAIHCQTSSLPRLPNLAEALQGRRPPAFLLLAGSDSMAGELLARLENLFPGSVIGAGVAAERRTRDRRRLLLVGPGGGGSAAAAASPGAAAPPLPSESTLASSSSPASSSSAVTAGELEGHFQRMLLDRDGSATASTSGSSNSSNSTSSNSTSGGTSSNGSGGNAGGGRRRRPAPGATVTGRSTAGGPGAGAGGNSTQLLPSLAASAIDEVGTVAETASAAHVDELQPPYIIVGDEVHYGGGGGGGGGALLAVYPKLPGASISSPSSTTTATSSPPPSSYSDLRLGAAACDLLARLALGNDHLHHVVLWGSASTAISPPPTGPEPVAPLPAASDNPFYWAPARVDVPGHVQLLVPDSSTRNLGDLADPGFLDFADPDLADFPGGPHSQGGSPNHHQQRAAGLVSSLRSSLPGEGVPLSAVVAGEAAAAVAAPAGAVAGTGASGGAEGAPQLDGKEEEEGGGTLSSSSSPASPASWGVVGLSGLPLFPLEGVILFPGQTIQLRIFEKRYRLLARTCVEDGAAFGLCWRGTGTTAVVRSYHAPEDGTGDVLVLLEGGVRFSYDPEDIVVLPASYGLNAATRAVYVVDDPPDSEEDVAALVAAAHSVLNAIAGVLEESTTPSVRYTARTFANALHFASNSSNSNSSSSHNSSSSSRSSQAASQLQQLPPPEPQLGQGNSAVITAANSSNSNSGDGGVSGGKDDGGGGGGGAALLAEDLAKAKGVMDAETASLLSLYLAPHVPVHLESLRREWFASRSALWRLQQEAAWLRSRPRVAMAVASSVLRLPREHPLRAMMGLSRVAVEGS